MNPRPSSTRLRLILALVVAVAIGAAAGAGAYALGDRGSSTPSASHLVVPAQPDVKVVMPPPSTTMVNRVGSEIFIDGKGPE